MTIVHLDHCSHGICFIGIHPPPFVSPEFLAESSHPNGHDSRVPTHGCPRDIPMPRTMKLTLSWAALSMVYLESVQEV